MTTSIEPPADTQTKGDVMLVFESSLDSLLSAKITYAAARSPEYERLWREIARVSRHGKRLRPYMLSLTAQGYDRLRSVDGIMPAMMAIELLHIAMLVHDDIIDRDIVRHGEATIHGAYIDTHYAVIDNERDRRHFSKSAALLAGDALLAEAYDQLLRCENIAPQQLIAATHELHDAVHAVIGGELIDTESTFMYDSIEDVNTDAIAHQKTASYSFIAPLVIGATIAGADTQQIQILRKLGDTLGIGFQLRDDLLGVFGDTAITGKGVEGDIREGKVTAMVQYLYRHGEPDHIRIFEQAFRNTDATPSQIEAARMTLVDSGSRQITEDRIRELREQARLYIEQLDLDTGTKADLQRIADKALERKL